MKRIYYAIVLICISIIYFNCQKEISYNRLGVTGTENNNADPVTATLQGNIQDETGQPLTGVIIKVGSKTASTNARGYFRVVNAPLDKYTSLVIADKPGYFRAYRVFNATSGVNQVIIQLIKKTLAGTVNSSSGGTVALTNGSAVSFPANSVVKAAGGSYSGTINVFAAYIDPSSPQIARTIPGSFLANDKDGKQVTLASYGMMAVVLESASGEKLQIASGKTASLTTAIPVSLQASAPSTISLWYVDENTGIWKEEGTAVKNGTNYIGDVTHFTYWNCDIPGPVVNLSATFKTADGLPLVYADVRIRPAGNNASAHGYTDSLGQVSGPVPANKDLLLELMSPCNTVMYSKNIGSFSANASLGTITVNNNPSLVTVKGRLLNCSGAPVTKGFATINYGNVIRHVSVENNGEFTSTFYSCAGMPSVCEIYGTDVSASQQGTTAVVTVTSPTTDIGNLTACGTSSLQFINYNINGTNYSVSSLVAGDNVTGMYSDSLTSQSVYISGYHANTSAISFEFNAVSTVSGNPVKYLSLQQFGYATTLLPPFNVTLTNNAETTGQFYEGNIRGSI